MGAPDKWTCYTWYLVTLTTLVQKKIHENLSTLKQCQ